MEKKKSKWDKMFKGEMPMTGPVDINVDVLVKLGTGEHLKKTISYEVARLQREETCYAGTLPCEVLRWQAPPSRDDLFCC